MIVPLGLADLAAASDLLEEAGLASGRALFRRYLDWPGRYLGWVEAGTLIAMCGALWQPPAAFIGCMAVRTARQGQGLGRRLLVHVHELARAAGATTMLLEATEAGERLYTALGYVTEYETLITTRPATTAGPAAATAALRAGDAEAIVALDRAVLGVDRAAMLRALLAEPVAALVVRDPDGRPTGYGLRLDNRLGSIVALNDQAGGDLLAALAPGGEILALPAPCAAALAMSAALGFAPVRRLRRMRLGPAVGLDPRRVWALLAAGAG